MMPFHKKEKYLGTNGYTMCYSNIQKDKYGSKHHKFRAIKTLR